MIDGIVSSGEGREPTAHIQLSKDHAKAVRKYKPGNVVKIVLIGSIDDMSFSKPDDPEESGFEGSCRLKIQKMEILSSAKNEIAELLDDDE